MPNYPEVKETSDITDTRYLREIQDITDFTIAQTILSQSTATVSENKHPDIPTISIPDINSSDQHTVEDLATPTITPQNIVVSGIDDFLVVNFSLDTFKKIQFTRWKQCVLYIQDRFPFIVQSLFVPIFHLLFGIFFIINIRGKEQVRTINGPILIISNHIGIYDSFLFDLIKKPFSEIFPFRFMGTRVFDSTLLRCLKKIGIIDIVYLLFGVFKVTPGEGAEKSLKCAYEIIKSGGTVAMYPEGRIWKPNKEHSEPIGPFRWGAAILAKNTQVQVLPVALKRTRIPGSFRSRIDMHIGAVFHVDSTQNAEDITMDMRKKILDLYHS